MKRCPKCGGSVVYTGNLIHPDSQIRAECFDCGSQSDWCSTSSMAYRNLELRVGKGSKMTGRKYYYISDSGEIRDNIDYDCRTEWFMSAMGNMFYSKENAQKYKEKMMALWKALKHRDAKVIIVTDEANAMEWLNSAERFMKGIS